GSFASAHPIDKAGQFMIFAICNPKNMEKVDKVIAEELDKALKEGVTLRELEEGKAAYLESLKVRRASDTQQASALATGLFVGRTMQHEIDLEKKVADLTVNEVNAALRKHLSPKRLVLVRAGDFRGKSGEQK